MVLVWFYFASSDFIRCDLIYSWIPSRKAVSILLLFSFRVLVNANKSILVLHSIPASIHCSVLGWVCFQLIFSKSRWNVSFVSMITKFYLSFFYAQIVLKTLEWRNRFPKIYEIFSLSPSTNFIFTAIFLVTPVMQSKLPSCRRTNGKVFFSLVTHTKWHRPMSRLFVRLQTSETTKCKEKILTFLSFSRRISNAVKIMKVLDSRRVSFLPYKRGFVLHDLVLSLPFVFLLLFCPCYAIFYITY